MQQNMGPVLCDPQTLIKDLNPQQSEAVKYYGQALLIGAGAGSGKTITKILTIEASGIGIACVAARHFGNAPVVFAKKAQSINLDGDQYTTTVYSFTKQKEFPVIVSKRYLNEGDHVLLIDDFLANGKALRGLIELCHKAGAVVEGIGIAVEKGFQGGGDKLREEGYDVDSLAIVESMDSQTGSITFRA